jgi:ELWxxDGT repeat protein
VDEVATTGRRLFWSDETSIWTTDGTPAGTWPVDKLRSPGLFQTVDDHLVFLAEDPESGREPWVTGDTDGSARLLLDIRPGSRGSCAGAPTSRDGTSIEGDGERLFFTADDGIHGVELWASDGTTAGTHLVKDIRPGSAGSYPVTPSRLVGAWLFFVASDGVHGPELWASDGTEAGTSLVADIVPGRRGLLPEPARRSGCDPA